MPTYDYHCTKCGHCFETTMTLAEHQRKCRPSCPKCNSREIEQVPARFQVVTSKKT